MPKRVSRFICDICGHLWPVESLARYCEDKHIYQETEDDD